MPPGVLVKAFPSAKHIPQKMFHRFYRGSNPAGLLKFHKIHDLLGFEPCQGIGVISYGSSELPKMYNSDRILFKIDFLEPRENSP